MSIRAEVTESVRVELSAAHQAQLAEVRLELEEARAAINSSSEAEGISRTLQAKVDFLIGEKGELQATIDSMVRENEQKSQNRSDDEQDLAKLREQFQAL